MRLRLLPLLLFFAFTPLLLRAQSAKDITVPVSAVLVTSPSAGIILNWAMPAVGNVLVLRRAKGQGGNQWVSVLSQDSTTQSSLTDIGLTMGQTYEYVVQRQLDTLFAYGYAQVAVEADLLTPRGKVLLFVDSSLTTPLASEIERLKYDLAGDGWAVVQYISGSTATVTGIKAQIVAAFNADPANVRSVFLLGAIPIPYSGNASWDGHTDHQGAWPSDGFYGDVNGNWTDLSINNVTPSRAANDNVPGDGKYDQSYFPGQVELPVGRVDFRRLVPASFGVASVADLYKRYLDKNHAWRIKSYTVENKALVDDNFGYFSGEAFAANGWRNAYPLVGEANIVQGDFFNNTNPQSYLMGYGCGGGSYTSAGGVGNSDNFATDTVNIVFSMLFGSYHGDWDYETNPFMPSALASRGGILSCSWSGRPHWFYQALASGETLGYCTKETQNAQYNNGFYPTIGESGAHTALLGDPTLRAHIVAPPSDLVLDVVNCGDVALNWTASVDSGILGYIIYRSVRPFGGFIRLTGALVTTTSYTDLNPINDTLYYQVRAVFRQTAPAGGAYMNSSTAAQANVVYQAPAPPLLSTTTGTLNCIVSSVTMTVSSNVPLASVVWNGPGLNNATNDTVTVNQAGIYTVVAFGENGCSATSNVLVGTDNVPPQVQTMGGVLTCTDTSVTLIGFVSPGSTFVWSGPGITQPNVLNPVVTVPGVYTLTATNPVNGCTDDATTTVTEDVNLPIISFPTEIVVNCSAPCLALLLPDLPGMLFYLNGQPVQPGSEINFCEPGIQTITVESVANGCTQDYPITVEQDITAPLVSIAASSDVISCNTPVVVLTAITNVAQASYFWSGPGITILNETLVSPEVSQPGNYNVTVTDDLNGCTATDVYTIISAGDQPAAFAAGDTLTCGQPVGQLSGTSDTPGVTYAWTGPNNFSSPEANPAVDEPGLYILVVTAPGGCTGSDFTQVVELPNDIDLLMTALTLSCENDSFEIVPQVSGGVAPFNYLWHNGATTETIIVPSEDLLDLSVTITDANGCVASFTSTNIVIIFSPPITFDNVVLVDISAPGASDGSISGMAFGGNPPYQYLWSNGGQTNTITNLSAGFYTVTVTDASGCTYSTSFPIGINATQDPSTVLRFMLTPNPGFGPLTLYLELDKVADLQLLVFDEGGKLVLEKSGMRTENLELPLNLNTEAAGMYTFLVRIDGSFAIRRWVLMR